MNTVAVRDILSGDRHEVDRESPTVDVQSGDDTRNGIDDAQAEGRIRKPLHERRVGEWFYLIDPNSDDGTGAEIGETRPVWWPTERW